MTDDERNVDLNATPPPTPRWVKVSMILIVALIVLVVVLMLAGGSHGPGRHGG